MATSTKFDFDKVYDQLIEDAGKTRVVYINGIFTGETGFDTKVKETFKFQDDQNVYKLGGSGFRGSINFTPEYNPTSPNTGGNILQDLGLSVIKFFVKTALDQFDLLDLLTIPQQIVQFSSLLGQFLTSPNPAQLLQDDGFTAQALDFLSSYLPGGDVINNLITSLPADLQEALTQYWFKSTDVSKPVNNNWTQGNDSVVNWVNNSDQKNSLILIGYSQGNFFLEDGLIDIGSQVDPSRIRLLAMASPTMYSAAGGMSQYGGKNVIYGSDPVTKLQLTS
jgi:hypothetical protein